MSQTFAEIYLVRTIASFGKVTMNARSSFTLQVHVADVFQADQEAVQEQASFERTTKCADSATYEVTDPEVEP